MEESERAGDGRKEFQVCLLLCKASRKERRRNPLPAPHHQAGPLMGDWQPQNGDRMRGPNGGGKTEQERAVTRSGVEVGQYHTIRALTPLSFLAEFPCQIPWAALCWEWTDCLPSERLHAEPGRHGCGVAPPPQGSRANHIPPGLPTCDLDSGTAAGANHCFVAKAVQPELRLDAAFGGTANHRSHHHWCPHTKDLCMATVTVESPMVHACPGNHYWSLKWWGKSGGCGGL